MGILCTTKDQQTQPQELKPENKACMFQKNNKYYILSILFSFMSYMGEIFRDVPIKFLSS